VYCRDCDENLVFVNMHIVNKPVLKCPYCDVLLNVTIVNAATGTIREKYLGDKDEEDE
jgi:phage FluMu protein Com